MGKALAGVSLFFGTQHIRTDQWVRLASRFGGEFAGFLDPSPRSCHWVPLKIGADTTAIMQTRTRSFSSGRVSIPMVMTVRFVMRSSASSEGENWLRSGKAPRRSIAHFGTQHIRTDQWVRLGSRFGGESRRLSRPIGPIMPLASFGNTVVGVVRGGKIGFVRGAWSADAIGFVRGNGACGRALVVDRYELSKSRTREDSSFIIGRRRERVPGIR